jgi:nitrous oxide reductase accessory protein NosL
MSRIIKRVGLLYIFILVLPSVVSAQPLDLPDPQPTDTCPVCGMFVAKYRAWAATVVYRDDHAHHFDGTKDMFKYLFDMPKWAPGHRPEDIDRIGVTEYYSLTRIDAHQAYYVIGSDVRGPMGHELIPLESEADAAEFLQDHKGKRILRFDQVSAELLQKLDKGQFE